VVGDMYINFEVVMVILLIQGISVYCHAGV